MEPPLKKLNIAEFRAEDRISQLPDPILHSILMRLLTRDAFPTVVLSKRWKELWASMPYFNIYEDGRSAEAVSKCVHFVDSLLQLCDQSDIQSFWLRFGFSRERLEQKHINKWIGHLVRRNVKILGFEGLLCEDVTLPSCLFSSHSLQELKFVFSGFNVKLTVPDQFLGFWRLRKLCVMHITFCDSLKKIISGCPVLEHLDMTSCQLYCLDISSDSLETLSIWNCEIAGSIIRISCPRAQQIYFSRNKVNSLEVCLGKLSSLVSAFIQVTNGYFGKEAKPLNFVTSRNKNSSGDSALQTFSNLKKLKFEGGIMNESFPAVVYFLNRSPNLQQLYLFGRFVSSQRVQSNLEQLHLHGRFDPEEFYYRECSYTCAHIKRKIMFHCGLENGSLIEKMEKYLQSKCCCHSKLIVDASLAENVFSLRQLLSRKLI